MNFNNLKLVKEGILAFIIKIVGAITGFIYTIILSKQFDAEGVGIYSLALSIITLGLIFSKFGLENALIKFSSIYKERNVGKTIRQLYRDSLFFSTITSIFIIIVLIIMAPIISKYIYKKENLMIPLIIMSLTVLPTTLLTITTATLKGLGQVKLAMFLESVLATLINILLLILFSTFFKVNNISFIIILYLVGYLITMLLSLYYGKKTKEHYNDKVDSSYKFKKVIEVSLPLLMVSSMNYILSSTDTIMLGLWTTEANIGVYNVAIKITQISSMLLIAINSVLGPKFSVLFANNDKDSIIKIVKKTTHMMLIVGILFFIGIITFGDFILGIFGREFIVGKSVLFITAIGQLIVLATGPVATLLMMTGHEKVHRNNTIFCGIINIILNLILIPSMGIVGAAVATTISLIIKNISAVILVYRKLHIIIF